MNVRPAMIAIALLLAGCVRATDGASAVGDASANEGSAVTVLHYATPYGPSHPFSRADQRWIEFVETQSNGRLRIHPSWSGALLSSLHSMIELRHGVVDVGLITPIYVKGGVHLIRTQSGFYSGVHEIEEQVELYRCLASAHPQFQRELEGLKVLAVQGGSLPGLITRERPVGTLDDLQGLRVRVPGELLNVMRELGADPVNMPMGDVYSALAKGVIDGVVAPKDTFRALHLAEVAAYYTPLAVPRGAYPARAMGIERWRSLSDAERAVLEASIPVWEAALADENRRALDAGWQYALEEGVVEVPIGEKDAARFDALYALEAEGNAASLSRYGIDGAAVLEAARASITPDGSVDCARPPQ